MHPYDTEEMIEAKKRCDGNEGRVLNASTLRAIQEYTGVHNLEEIVNKCVVGWNVR